jgi:hypothetical protein
MRSEIEDWLHNAVGCDEDLGALNGDGRPSLTGIKACVIGTTNYLINTGSCRGEERRWMLVDTRATAAKIGGPFA